MPPQLQWSLYFEIIPHSSFKHEWGNTLLSSGFCAGLPQQLESICYHCHWHLFSLDAQKDSLTHTQLNFWAVEDARGTGLGTCVISANKAHTNESLIPWSLHSSKVMVRGLTSGLILWPQTLPCSPEESDSTDRLFPHLGGNVDQCHSTLSYLFFF